MAVDTRKLVMGDWSRVVRDPLDVLRLVFGAGAIAFAAAGDAGGAFNMGLGFAVLVAARLANLPRVYDLALIVALAFTQGGESLGLYDAIGWYDRVVHFLVPMLTSQVIYLCLARLEVMPDPRQETLPRHEGDLIADASGSLAGGALMVLWSQRGWGSVRRIPGEDRREDTSA